MSGSNQSFFRSNLDKFLLVFLTLVFVAVGFHASHHNEDINSGYSQMVQQSTGLILGALLTLLTGLGNKKSSEPKPEEAIPVSESTKEE